MAKFGLFQDAGRVPRQTVEGDYMRQQGEYVTIFLNSKDPAVQDRQVGAFRLDKGQVVKEIS